MNLEVNMDAVKAYDELVLKDGSLTKVTEAIARASRILFFKRITGKNAWEIAIRFRVYEWLFGTFATQKDHESDKDIEVPITLADVVRHIGMTTNSRSADTLAFYRKAVLPLMPVPLDEEPKEMEGDEVSAVYRALLESAPAIGFGVMSKSLETQALLYQRFNLYESLFGSLLDWPPDSEEADERPIRMQDLWENTDIMTTSPVKSDIMFYVGTVHARVLQELKAEQQAASEGSELHEDAASDTCGNCRGLGILRDATNCPDCSGTGQVAEA